MRVSGFVGMIMGILNVVQWFMSPSYLWLGILHVPLLLVSAYAFVLSFAGERKRTGDDDGTAARI